MQLHFSLQSVLNYRHTRVEALEVELGQLQGEREKTLAFLESLRNRRRGLLDDMRLQQSGELDFLMLNQLKTNLKDAEARILKTQALLHEIEKAVVAKRAEMVAAKQEEEALVVLKNKEIERYQSELNRKENRLQDDIYIAQAFHHHQAGSSQANH
jgi:flagellar export protein FliJ